MRRLGATDGASTHVLEAVTIASVMLASVAFVVTVDIPASPTAAPRGSLLQATEDAMAILNDTPLDSLLGDNVLSVAILECLQNDCDRLEDRVGALLPEGARFGVYLSTPDGLYPVYAPRDPPGESVASRRIIEPAWSYQFLATSQDLYNPAEDPLVVYALPVYSGNALQQGGNGLRILATGTRDSDNSGYSLTGSGTTRSVDTDDVPVPSATSLYFVNSSGAPLATHDVRAEALDLGLTPSLDPIEFRLRVAETGGGLVPSGTILSVALPHGWNGTASPALNSDRWTILSDAPDRNGSASSVITAKLTSPITSGFAEFVFNATYQGDATDWYTFSAQLSQGAYARAQTLVRADEHALPSSLEYPTVVASIPRPLGVSATTTWTVGVFSPEAVDITRIEIQEEEGRAIFADVAPLSGGSGGGTWSHTGDTLVWTGAASVSQSTPLALTFEVTSSDIGGLASDNPPFAPAVDLGSFTARLGEEVAPGLYRSVVLPATADKAGYETRTDGLKGFHEAQSTSVYRTTALPGEIRYGVGYSASLQDSVFGSSAVVERRSVTPGETAVVDVDVQAALYELAVLGMEPSIDVAVYPPWAGDEREPIVNLTVYNGSVASGADTFLSLIDLDDDGTPEPSATMGRHLVEVDVPSSWLYGPYVVETQISWLETLDEVVDGVPLTEEVVRTARIYDYFTVRPTGAQLPPSPLYDVHLVAWFEDWR